MGEGIVRPGAGCREKPWPLRRDVSILRYPGGKRRLAWWAYSNLVVPAGVEIDLFVEPFAGGAAMSILFLERGVAGRVMLSDADPLVAALWEVVFSSRAERLAERIMAAQVTLAEWKRQRESDPSDKIDMAFKCLFLNRTSFSGSLRSTAGPIGGMAQASAYKIDCRYNRDVLARRVVQLSELAGRVVAVRCCDYREVVAEVSRMRAVRKAPDGVFWYLDPPFFAKADKLYRHVFGAGDHADLAGVVAGGLPGHWLLSYDDHRGAVEAYSGHPGFDRIDMDYTASGVRKKGGPAASEIVVSDLIEGLRRAGSYAPSELRPRRRGGPSGVAPV